METIEFAYVVALVMGLSEVLKIAGLKTQYIPLIGVLIGIASSFFVPNISLFLGIMGALSANGLYSGSKATMKKK